MTNPAPTAAEIIADLKAKGVTLLSAPGGKFPVPERFKDLMCLTSAHHLIVCSGEKSNRDVLAYLDLLRRNAIKPRVYERSVTFIRMMNEQLIEKDSARTRIVDTGDSTSKRQTEVIQMIIDAVRHKASDIHIAVFGDRGTIAYRIHGDLYKVQEPTAEKTFEMCSTIYQSMCDIADPVFKPHDYQDARMSAEFATRCGLFGSRVASAPTDSGSRMVIRLLYDSGTEIPSLDALGYLPEQVDMFDVMRRHTAGINILSGTTGSGKSTTLVSVMDSIIRDAKLEGQALHADNDAHEYLGVSVVTIEDPPEYRIHGATQTPLLVADKADETAIRRGWAKAITACMRQDPDIMMIGEIRDIGSARAAFDAAMTGHGVWTTVHTTDALGIMTRLQGLEVEKDRMLDPDIVTGLINQSLAQRLCPSCSIPWFEGGQDLVRNARQRKRIEDYCYLPGVRLRGQGCERCNNQGIVGRIVVAEIVLPNLDFMEVFQKDGKSRAKAFWVKEMGGITKCMALIRRINEGMIDPREGESKVSALDKDRVTLNFDYSHNGDFTQAHAILLPAEVKARVDAGLVAPDAFSQVDYDPLAETGHA